MRSKNFLVFIVFLVLSFILRFPSFNFPLDYDVGGHVFWGEQVAKSGFYTVLQELRPVGILTIFAIFFKFFGLHLIWVPILGAFFWALSAFILYRLAKTLFNSQRIAFLSALIFSLITASRAVQGEMVNMETFFITFSLLGIFFYFRSEKEGERKDIFFSGLFFGIAFLTKHLAVFDLFPVLLIMSLPAFRKLKGSRNMEKGLGILFRKIFVFLVGFIFPLLLVTFYFLVVGKLGDFYYWQFIKIHSNVSPFRDLGNPWENFWLSFGQIFRKTTVFWLLVAGGVINTLLFKRIRPRLFLFAWLLSVFTGIYLLWWFFPHHYLQLLPSLSIFAAVFLNDVLGFRLHVLSPIKIQAKNLFFAGVLVFGLIQYFSADSGYYFGYLEKLFNKINYKEYLEKAGFDVGPDGWLSFYQAGQYLRETSDPSDSLFAWASIPFIYTLSEKAPISWYVYKAPLQPKEILSRNFRRWFPDVEESRRKVMEDLVKKFPQYILVMVEPEKIFDELFSFSEFSNLIVNNYVFDQQFSNILIYKRARDRVELGDDEVVPLEIIKKFAAITDIEESKERITLTFEPMVNPGGILQNFQATYPEVIKVNFDEISAQFLGPDGSDFVGNATEKPSGVTDLHIRVQGQPKPVNFVRVKMGENQWNNQQYGVNPLLKVTQDGEVFDLYFEQPSNWEKETFNIYFIYKDGALAKTEIKGE